MICQNVHFSSRVIDTAQDIQHRLNPNKFDVQDIMPDITTAQYIRFHLWRNVMSGDSKVVILPVGLGENIKYT